MRQEMAAASLKRSVAAEGRAGFLDKGVQIV
jgi:hypothetical protein